MIKAIVILNVSSSHKNFLNADVEMQIMCTSKKHLQMKVHHAVAISGLDFAKEG
jgi:hypothetical protein